MQSTQFHTACSSSSRAKTLAVFVVALFSVFVGVTRPAISHPRPQSQLELDEQANQRFKSADAKLNAVYKKLMAQLDSKSQGKLKATQRAWIAFRDAEADFHADATARGGSIEPMDYSETAANVTKDRTIELERTLKDLSR